MDTRRLSRSNLPRREEGSARSSDNNGILGGIGGRLDDRKTEANEEDAGGEGVGG